MCRPIVGGCVILIMIGIGPARVLSDPLVSIGDVQITSDLTNPVTGLFVVAVTGTSIWEISDQVYFWSFDYNFLSVFAIAQI